MAILNSFNSLANRFDQPERHAPPAVPKFMDSYRSWPRFRKDIEAYLRDFFARADEHVKVLFLKEKCLGCPDQNSALGNSGSNLGNLG